MLDPFADFVLAEEAVLLFVECTVLVVKGEFVPVRSSVLVTEFVLVPELDVESDADPEIVRVALEDPVGDPVRNDDLEPDGQ